MRLYFKKAQKKQSTNNNSIQKHEATSNIIFNLSQMGLSLKEAEMIEIDTYFELLDLYQESMSPKPSSRMASQNDIDRFLL